MDVLLVLMDVVVGFGCVATLSKSFVGFGLHARQQWAQNDRFLEMQRGAGTGAVKLHVMYTMNLLVH